MDDNLILALDRLVHGISAKLCRQYGCWERRDDLVGEGHLAIQKSVARFDPAQGVKLETYVHPAIRGAMFDYLQKESLVKISRSDRELARQVRQAHDELMKQLQRQPTVEDIAQHLQMETTAIEDALQLLALGFESLDAPDTEEEEAVIWEPSAGGLTPEETTLLHRAILELPENYRAVVIHRLVYGLDEEETATRLGKPRGTIKSDLSRARSHLRKALPPMMTGGGHYV